MEELSDGRGAGLSFSPDQLQEDNSKYSMIIVGPFRISKRCSKAMWSLEVSKLLSGMKAEAKKWKGDTRKKLWMQNFSVGNEQPRFDFHGSESIAPRATMHELQLSSGLVSHGKQYNGRGLPRVSSHKTGLSTMQKKSRQHLSSAGSIGTVRSLSSPFEPPESAVARQRARKKYQDVIQDNQFIKIEQKKTRKLIASIGSRQDHSKIPDKFLQRCSPPATVSARLSLYHNPQSKLKSPSKSRVCAFVTDVEGNFSYFTRLSSVCFPHSFFPSFFFLFLLLLIDVV